MIKRTGLALVLAGAVAGAGCGTDETEPATPSSVAEPQAASDEAIVHATLSLGGEHVLEFTEFKPGMVGVVERGRNLVDAPKLTSELGKLPWLEVYRHFAGASAPVSKGMAAAHARVLESAGAPPSPSPRDLERARVSRLSAAAGELGKASTGEGPHFYNDAEQSWFRTNACNGARSCIQGFFFARDFSQGKIGRGSATGLVGSEGKVNGTLKQYYQYTTWNIFFGTERWWIEFGSLAVPPGFWVNIQLSGGNNYIQWELTGVERNTSVSLAAYY